MFIYWFFLLIWGMILRGSEIEVRSGSNSQDSYSSEIDTTCDFALSRYYPDRNQSFVVRPYLRRILSETMSQNSPTREPIEQSPMHELVIRAAQHAIEDKIKELSEKEKALTVIEHRIQKKLSKKQALGISAICGVISSIATLVITILSK